MNFTIHKNFLNNIIFEHQNYNSVKKKLNQANIKLLVVLNKSYQVLGSISDGDIRRKGLNKKSNEIKLYELMNNKPFLMSNTSSISKSDIRKFKYGIVVDSKKKFLDIRNLRFCLKNNSTAAVVMAGGFGKRLRPLTNIIPKPLIEIRKKTMIKNIIDKFLIAEIGNIYVSLYYMNRKISKELDNINMLPNVNINKILEKRPLGTAGCLSNLSNTNFSNFIICNSDLITEFKFNNILKFHLKKKSDLTVLVKNYKYRIPYGVMNIKNNKIQNIEEKPEINFKILSGIYILSKKLLKTIKKNKKLDMPDLINSSIKKKFKVNFFQTKKNIIDVSSKTELFKLNPEYKRYFI